MSIEIYTYGYGDLMQTALNAIAAIVSSSNFKGMLATAIALYLARVFWNTAHGRYVDFGRILKNITLIIALALSLTQIKDTVTVTDRTTPSLSGIVDNVPIAVYLPLWFSNRAEYVITRTFETAFSLPDGVSYNSVGYSGGVKNLRDAAYYIRIEDAYLKESLVQFYKDCVFAALIEGLISPDQVKRDTVKNVITAAASAEPSRTTVYYSSSNPDGVSKTCEEAAGLIKTDLNKDRDKAFADLAKVMGYGTNTAALESVLGSELQYFMGISSNAKDAVYQEALLTVSHDALIRKAGEAGLDPNQLGLTVATTKEKLFLTNASMGDTIRAFLPYIRAFLNILFVAVTPILIVIGIGIGRPLQYIGTAVMLAAFPLFWGMIGSIINWIIASQVNDLSQVIETTKYSTATINIENYPVVVSALKEWLTIGGWASSLIIILSIALLTGSTYAFVRFAGGFASGIAGAASSSAGSLAMGNISAGNVSTDNVSANNTSMNKWDSTFIFSGGYQLSNRENIINQHIFDNENLYRDRVAQDTGATTTHNGVTTALADSKGAGHTTTAGTGESGGKTYTYGHNVGNTKQTTDGVNYLKNDSGSKTVSAQQTAGTSTQGALGQQGNFALSGGEDRRYNYSLNSRNSILDSDKYSLNLSNADKTVAKVGAGLNLGSRGGKGGAGGGAPSGENLPAGLKGLVKKGAIGLLNLGNLNASVEGFSENNKSVSSSHGGSRDRSVGTGEDFGIAEALSRRYSFTQNASFNRSGNISLTGNEVISDGMAYGVIHSTGENRLGTDSRTGGESLAYSQQAHFGQQASRTSGFRGTADGWSRVVETAKRLGVYDSLVAEADRIVSQNPELVRANSWLSQTASPEQMELMKIQQAYGMSPKFREIVSNLAEGREVKELFDRAQDRISDYSEEVKEKSKAINTDVLNQNLKNEVVRGKNEYGQRAEELREQARGRAVGLVHGARTKSEDYKDKADSYSGDLQMAHKRLTDLVNNRTGEFNQKQSEAEQKASEKASIPKALGNLWGSDSGKVMLGLAGANAMYNLSQGAKTVRDVMKNLKRAGEETITRDAVGAPIQRFERQEAESLAERIASRIGLLGRGALKALGPVSIAAEVLNPDRVSSSEISGTVSSDKDLQNLQPNQTARIGNTDLVIQNLGNGRYALAGHGQSQVLTEKQARELLRQHANLTGSQAEIEKQLLELARREGTVVLNQEKLERTGSSRVVADPEKLAKLLEEED